jgi:dihydroorotase
MPLSKLSGLTLPATFDAHVHLRDGAMMEAVVPTIRSGGTNTVYVMPNLTPPLTTPAAALSYLSRLRALDPSITYLPTLYLHESITPSVVAAAKAAGITGIKSYPAGVTTNSASGVISYEPFYPVFSAMEEHGLVLNLHGECPSSHSTTSGSTAITILNAEARFLPTLHSLHTKFPKLKIVLEHCTTAAAVAAVRACGPNVVGTITAHHLFLTIDDWADDPFAYCKPVAKTPEDREELLRAVVSSKGKFLFGTDSAPHDVKAKKGGTGKTAAGVFTQPYATQLVIGALEEAIERGVIQAEEVTEEVLKGFLGGYGREFYGIEDNGEKIVLKKGKEVVVQIISGDGVEVVPFRRGKSTWSVEWSK